MTRRRVGFQQALTAILQEDRPLTYGQLRDLSNLDPEDLAVFFQLWAAAPTERRRQVVRAMAQLNEDSPDVNFRDVLLFCLGDEDEAVRIAAIEGLSDDESFDLLDQLLPMAADDPAAAVRVQAILALGRFVYLMETTDLLGSYHERLLQLLLDIFGDELAPLEARRRALETVSYLSGLDEVEEAIERAYRAESREMRASAVHAMGHHMAERWRPALLSELSSAEPGMRYEAAHACGEMGHPDLVRHLAPLVEDEDHEVAREAIWALGEIGGTQARRLLERCLRRPEEDIREAAEEALHTLRFFEDPMGTL